MRQAAWLSAPLDTDDRRRQSKTRHQIADETGDELPPFPPNPAPYLTRWLFEIGAGDGAISWHEMRCWQAISGVELLPAEAKILRALSVQYANEKFEARKPDHPMPYNLERDQVEGRRETVSAKIESLFGAARRQ